MTGQGILATPEIESAGPGVRAELERAIPRLGNLLQLLPDLQWDS